MSESYTRCWKDAQNQNKKYSLYVRSRDDVGFLEPLPESLFDDIPNNAIIVSKCRSNGGINDRFAIVPADVAECYFNTPYVELYSGITLDVAFSNTESYFKRIFWKKNCTSYVQRQELVPYKMEKGGFLEYDINRGCS
jgi:hypothetical protein